MVARLLDYFRRPEFIMGIMIFITVGVIYGKEMRKLSWKRKVGGGLLIFGVLGLSWLLSWFLKVFS